MQTKIVFLYQHAPRVLGARWGVPMEQVWVSKNACSWPLYNLFTFLFLIVQLWSVYRMQKKRPFCFLSPNNFPFESLVVVVVVVRFIIDYIILVNMLCIENVFQNTENIEKYSENGCIVVRVVRAKSSGNRPVPVVETA